jgi:hypothetical protein
VRAYLPKPTSPSAQPLRGRRASPDFQDPTRLHFPARLIYQDHTKDPNLRSSLLHYLCSYDEVAVTFSDATQSSEWILVKLTGPLKFLPS